MRAFDFLRVYCSPFKFIYPKLYIGPIRIGVPIFYPRRWIKDINSPYMRTAIPKRIGFDFVGLGWKTKWTETDYRHEYNPVWSFVFFKWQIALLFIPEHAYAYWEAWLYYDRNTYKRASVQERIAVCREKYPQTYTSYSAEGERTINYYEHILKKKYL